MQALMWISHCERPLESHELCHALAVFPTVQAAGRARRADCQEPGTGRDGAKYPVLVFEKEKPPSGAKTAGLAI